MSVKINFTNFKNKKDFVEELNYYKSLIIKKVKRGDYNSALEKVRSALVILEDHRESYNIKKEILEFQELSNQVKKHLLNNRIIYERRFNNLLKEKLNESNLENFSKLLAMLKNDVDQNLNKFNLRDISANINKYFKFIKRMYEILSCYKTLNYHDVSDKIFQFVKDIKSENFPNLKMLILLTYQNLIKDRLFEFSKDYDKISIAILSEKMAISQNQLKNFIDLIREQPRSPIHDFKPITQEIVFKKSKF